MSLGFDHGRCLTDDEYRRAVIALHANLPPMPSHEQDLGVRRAELNLTIDYRLGIAFPSTRREALWRIHEQVEKRRVRLVLWHLIPEFKWRATERGASRLARRLIHEFAKVLTPAELAAYFEDDGAY
jgi:hypothetical protein